MTTREDILSLAEDLEDGVQRNGTMDGEDGAVDLYDIDAANEVMGEAAKMLRTLAAPTPPAAEATQADMAAFGASDVACYLYPDSGKERAAFIAGAAHAAEAPGQEPVAVKPLEWEQPSRKSNGCWTAQSPFGAYSVVNEGGWHASRDEAPRDFYFEWSGQDMSRDTLYTAQAAAQADYERRIRSALVSAPPTYADAEAKGFERGIETAAEAQPSTAGNPFESAYQKGRFDGIMEYAAAIRSLASPAPKGET